MRAALGKIGGIAAAELQRDGVFLGVEPQELLAIAAQDRAGGDHLRI